MKSSFLAALACQNNARPPVWLMRQAGRYMPEYQALRSKHSLWQMFHCPEVAVEVTKLPLSLLGVDAAILFSDILVVVEMLGLSIQFPESGGPRVEPAISSAAQIDQLPLLAAEESVLYVLQTIAQLKAEIHVPLIGFCGGPFTVASYCIDSGSKEQFVLTKKWIKEDPMSLHRLLQKLTTATIAYLKGQISQGVDAIQIFDSWLNILDQKEREAFAYPYLRQIIEALKETQIPVIIFCRNSSLFPEELVNLKPACISFDWHCRMAELRSSVPKQIAVQGNLDPSILKLSKDLITQKTRELLDSMKNEPGYILNLGHGVTPDIPLDHVRHFVNLIKSSN